ncbi:hypothetical protein [Adlercreutzia sp. ZJ141]|uniref:hypothetical protein n=1 Tax=Adlercreutzia sp. ZJ141 TaxID=2709406 RepID=UPI0013EB317D|nr:hypothetical protein [Adlercreutzia sp. ZJ141]
MNNTIATAFYIDEDSPLVQYEITFQEKQKFLISGIDAYRSSSNIGNVYADVTETLRDDIKWEPHVDKADKIDYIVAVSSGVLAGLIDVFYVGDFSLDRASEWGTQKVEKLVMKVARVEGYSGDDLNSAIKTLEKKYPFAADGNTNDFGGGLNHHLRDFSHHFSIGGLFFSIITQFTGLVVGTDETGTLRVVHVPESHKACIGKNFQEKIAFGTIGWFFHMVSDMAGSSGSLMGGTGIPGPLVSFMKELSSLPFFKDSTDGDMGFRLWVTKLFNGTFFADHDENGKIIKSSMRKFDLRTEIGILGEISRQTIPVLINQCVVRGFYFCRRLSREIRELKIRGISDLGRIAPEDILPWNTSAMRRMVTVSSGIFTGVDIADAAVRAIKSEDPVAFFLRVNYVGVATFVIACVVDANAALEGKNHTEDETPEEAFEHSLSNLGCLKLDFMQARLLHSIEHAIVAHDIATEKHPKRANKKRTWLKEWDERVVEAIDLVWAADTGYFLDNAAIYDYIEKQSNSTSESWLYLIAMEAKRFRPYIPLYGDNDELYKGLKLGSDYFSDVFCEQQTIVNKKVLSKINKAVISAKDRLDNVVTKRVASVAGTVVIVAATGGLAFYFAPGIAPTLAAAFGLEATLYGAALTSASLAFLGGGAIAAGGFGMAGGTMFIAGGGALLGAVGGSGVSAVTSMALSTGESYVLNECAKLVAFCEEILIMRYSDLSSVREIHSVLNQRIIELEAEIEAIKRGVLDEDIPDNDDNDDEKCEISPKRMIKILSRSCKYMKHSSDELAKALNETRKKPPASIELSQASF